MILHLQAKRAREHKQESVLSSTAAAPARSSVSLRDAIEKFLLNRQVGNCTARTLEVYARNLRRFAETVPAELGDCSPAIIEAYLASLQQRLNPASVHQHFRCLKTFFTWCLEAGLLPAHPMRGIRMKLPKTLPRVPDGDEIKRLLMVCADTFEGYLPQKP